jgi:hypothetical protein
LLLLCPQGSSETAAESLLTLDDATALTAAEQLVQTLARLSCSSSDPAAAAGGTAAAAAGDADAMDVDANQPQQQQQQQGGEGAQAVSDQQPTTTTSSSSSKEQQLLVGRRLLQALIGVWGDKSRNSSGKRMCFYAQELNPKLGRARGLDLHSVAARLEAGLHDATQQPLEVRGASKSNNVVSEMHSL